jgi:chromosomal replication initiator protein
MTTDELWQTVLAEIELSTSRANFVTWFRNTSIHSKEGGRIIVAVPNAFTKEWLQNKYNKTILKILRENDPSIKEIEYTMNNSSLRPATTPNEAVRRPVPVLTINDAGSGFKQITIDEETNLNPRYTFDSFVIGSFNELAHAASQAVTKNLGTTYNPLFIYGGVGVGKTHLLQATGNGILKLYPGLRVKYIPSEKFTEEVVTSIRNQTINKMKEWYADLDVLIIDDIQFIAGKEKTQEELFHVFNALYQKNKQIIFSSDRPPKAIAAIEERLRSRFGGGMIADVGIPDFETRIVILRSKLQEKNISLPNDIISFIASSVQKNIRELEGALNRVLAYWSVSQQQTTVQDLQKILKNLIAPPKKNITPKKILYSVAEFYDVPVKELVGQKRKREVVRPRQIIMYLLRNELKSSYPFIGDVFGGKDHTTVIHACEKIGREVAENESFNEELALIRQKIYDSV